MAHPHAPYPPPPTYPPPPVQQAQAAGAPVKKIRNHGAIWAVSILVGGGLIALGFFLHASWEHSPSYPRWLRRLVNRNEGPVLFGGGVLLIALFAMLCYWRGWFSKLPLQARLDLAAINARLDASGVAVFPVALAHDRRLCHGTLMLSPGELIFRCLHDEGMAAAAAGNAVAGQFGLIGGLIGGAASGVRSHARDKEIAAARAATDPLPFEQQLAFNPHSFRLGAHDLGGLTTKLGARSLVTPKGPYILHSVAEDDFASMIAWLSRRGVRIENM
jgi:hypothetical protein